jgi:hypothetical protein
LKPFDRHILNQRVSVLYAEDEKYIRDELAEILTVPSAAMYR